MLSTLKLELKARQIERISYQKAVLLQSILMEKTDISYAEKMHISGLHPYSQAVIQQEGKTYGC